MTMLSFIRDQGAQLPQERKDKQDKETVCGPEQKYIGIATKAKQVRKGTYILCGLFCLGIVCLIFMIKKSSPAKASAASVTEETQIENVITRLIGVKKEIFGHMDEIVKKFYEFSDIPQVKVSELVKNPFKIEQFTGGLKTVPKESAESSDIDMELLWQQRIMQQSSGMQLLSIMQSEQGYCCMIDNKIFHEGDYVRGFKISRITDSYVQLEADAAAGSEEGDNRTYTGKPLILKLAE